MGQEQVTAKITYVRFHDFDINVHKKINADSDADAKQTAVNLAKEYKEEHNIQCDSVRILLVGQDGIIGEVKDALKENF